ncbi:sugar kinase [Paenibacillus sp. FJAT-27812]|uniref:sugar kinase n=1 Tax=Paenibacillus sp. FJAT-27812 TaxID=1684143 RepID=UPI0006A78E1A|nr:sugar kinase [Paenibacillus sp. FJAT-27812]
MKEAMLSHKIILIKRRTRLEELAVRYNTVQQAQFYIERLGADFGDYIAEDERYRKAVAHAAAELSVMGRVQIVEREHVPNFIFGKQDVVVVIGQDGLVANTLKYLREQPLIGVNPDPMRWDGVLLPFAVNDLKLIVPDVLNQRRQIKEVTLAKVELNDGQLLYGVNDLFVGQKTHVSARYSLMQDNRIEQQSSSGIIVSTGLGSTGWFKSVLAGAAGIVSSVTNQQITLAPNMLDRNDFACHSPYLYFSVREPFASKITGAELVFGQIDEASPLRITSQMPENGVIFSDGMESDYLSFNSGVEATISPAESKGQLII